MSISTTLAPLPTPDAFTRTLPDAGIVRLATFNADVAEFSARSNSSVEFAASVSAPPSSTIPFALVCSTLNVVPALNVMGPMPVVDVSRRRSVAVSRTESFPG